MSRQGVVKRVVLATVAAAVVFVLWWFQPQKLWIDEGVSEERPAVDASELARGTFVSLDHGTSGVVKVLRSSATDRLVRIESLETSNGPDLFVYLSANPADGPEDRFDDDYVNLGRLKGNVGDQNYAVPASVDIDRLGTVVIWCDRFDSAFGAADLVTG